MSTENNPHSHATVEVGAKQYTAELIEIATRVLFMNHLPPQHLGIYTVVEIEMSGEDVVVRLRKPQTT